MMGEPLSFNIGACKEHKISNRRSNEKNSKIGAKIK
jgi:hypothetical protein